MEHSFLIAQVCGFIALLFSVARLQLKNPRHIALGEVPTAVFWSIQYYLLNAQAGLIINLACIVRGALVYLVPDKYLKLVLGSFLIIVTGLILKNYSSHFDLFALGGVYLYALACLFRDNRPLMARIIALHSIPWLIYNILFFSFFGVLSSGLGILSGIIGMARHEGWDLGRCYKAFAPNLVRSLFSFPGFRTSP